jgi:hypothetical protein
MRTPATGPVAQLISVMRAQLAARPRPRARAAATRAQASVSTLEALVGARVAHIAHDDPQRARKAFRAFLEVVLLSHLGKHLMHDPRFYQLVDDVHRSMEADPDTAALIAAAQAHLLRPE